ncbi:MAG TPA: Rrf2 family transcriptional regulator, partial [Chromatiales bacterium]|nr:Rrf2 family transcriptional regulator [Chromatiales bacterium]
MRLSTKGQHAVTAMLDLALNARHEPVALADISQSQGISLSYLEQLFACLRRQGLVEGVRGPGGGYRLARPPQEISMARIVAAVDGPGATRTTTPGADERPATRELWTVLSQRIYDFLDAITLADFLEQPE